MVEHYQNLLVDMNKECWKPVGGFSRYCVSNYGRVRNIQTGNILHGIRNSRYERVCLHNELTNYHGKLVSVHRLVANCFVENKYPNRLKYVNHIDENRFNNRADNLEWCTAKYNYNWSKDRAIKGARLSSVRQGKTKPIVVYNLYSQQALLYTSTRSAERDLGLSSSNMTPVLQGRNNALTMNGTYTLFYKEDWSLDSLRTRIALILKQSRTMKRFVAISEADGTREVFDSMRSASDKLGFPHQAISRCLYKGQKSSHGYKFSLLSIPIPSKLPKLIIKMI